MMLSRDVEVRSQEVARFLRREVRAAPYRTLGLALTAGYVLGGGLTPGLVRVLMVAGGRTMAGNFLTAAVRGAFDQWRMIDDTQGPFPAAWDPTPGTR
jgi:hypothetical protein